MWWLVAYCRDGHCHDWTVCVSQREGCCCQYCISTKSFITISALSPLLCPVCVCNTQCCLECQQVCIVNCCMLFTGVSRWPAGVYVVLRVVQQLPTGVRLFSSCWQVCVVLSDRCVCCAVRKMCMLCYMFSCWQARVLCYQTGVCCAVHWVHMLCCSTGVHFVLSDRCVCSAVQQVCMLCCLTGVYVVLSNRCACCAVWQVCMLCCLTGVYVVLSNRCVCCALWCLHSLFMCACMYFVLNMDFVFEVHLKGDMIVGLSTFFCW